MVKPPTLWPIRVVVPLKSLRAWILTGVDSYRLKIFQRQLLLVFAMGESNPSQVSYVARFLDVALPFFIGFLRVPRRATGASQGFRGLCCRRRSNHSHLGESVKNRGVWARLGATHPTPYSKYPLCLGYFLKNLGFHGKYLLFW